jgi:uncharacterized membrane protein/sporulation protein YlmC with PRC-barrel domain
MQKIPINATVECTDGKVGISSYVIFEPASKKITHIVVSDEQPIAPQTWLVPLALLGETGDDFIQLKCKVEELEGLEPFEELHYIDVPHEEIEYPSETYYMAPFVSPLRTDYVPVSTERIPPGELAIHRGALIHATDGYVGRLSEFLIDSNSGEITHLILEEGHLWGKQEITIPVSAIDKNVDDMIFLNLSKDQVAFLPTIPLRRHYQKPGKVGDNELIVAVFDGPDKAMEANKRLKGEKSDIVRNSAVIVKDEDGKTHFKEAQDVDAKHGRVFGAISGGIVGLIGGPIGAIVGALAGAVTGGIVAKHVDMGFSDQFLRRLQTLLQPGSSALLVMVESQDAAETADMLQRETEVVLRHTLADEIIERLNEAAGEEPKVTESDSNDG